MVDLLSPENIKLARPSRAIDGTGWKAPYRASRFARAGRTRSQTSILLMSVSDISKSERTEWTCTVGCSSLQPKTGTEGYSKERVSRGNSLGWPSRRGIESSSRTPPEYA